MQRYRIRVKYLSISASYGFQVSELLVQRKHKRLQISPDSAMMMTMVMMRKMMTNDYPSGIISEFGEVTIIHGLSRRATKLLARHKSEAKQN